MPKGCETWLNAASRQLKLKESERPIMMKRDNEFEALAIEENLAEAF